MPISDIWWNLLFCWPCMLCSYYFACAWKIFLLISTMSLLWGICHEFIMQVKHAWFFFSETGTKPPESCIFGQLLNIAAVVSKYWQVVYNGCSFCILGNGKGWTQNFICWSPSTMISSSLMIYHKCFWFRIEYF